MDVPYTLRNNDIVRFDSSGTANAGLFRDLKDDFDVLYEEAGSGLRMMSISTHDRISGIPGSVKILEEFSATLRNSQGWYFSAKG
ncbi:MAG TPA: hypothetical protein VIT21_01180 [Chthoniobacterales bacterium]